MIPLWAISAIGAGAVAGLAGFGLASRLDDAKLARAEAGWTQERTNAAQLHIKAMAQQIDDHNALLDKLGADNANAEERRRTLEQRALVAEAAAAAARSTGRRVRDALETHRLATRAALETAGSAADCSPATAAADLYAELLGRYRDRARSLGGAGQAVSAFAERESAAASECAERADTMIRASAPTR